MKKPIVITPKQLTQFNDMRNVLITVAKLYQTPEQLRRNCEKQFGLDYEECLEMTYENIQLDAKRVIKGVKALKYD